LRNDDNPRWTTGGHLKRFRIVYSPNDESGIRKPSADLARLIGAFRDAGDGWKTTAAALFECDRAEQACARVPVDSLL
jgi:hypothetical protein